MVLFWAAMCTPNAVGSVADEGRVVVEGQPEAGYGPLSYQEPRVAFWIGSLGTLGLSLGLGRQAGHQWVRGEHTSHRPSQTSPLLPLQ